MPEFCRSFASLRMTNTKIMDKKRPLVGGASDSGEERDERRCCFENQSICETSSRIKIRAWQTALWDSSSVIPSMRAIREWS
jgi:hypothetical protein